jgi:hypothetical protein
MAKDEKIILDLPCISPCHIKAPLGVVASTIAIPSTSATLKLIMHTMIILRLIVSCESMQHSKSLFEIRLDYNGRVSPANQRVRPQSKSIHKDDIFSNIDGQTVRPNTAGHGK